MRRLCKSNTDRVISGVCGGIAEYFNFDPTTVRLVWIALTLFGGLSIWIYIIAAIIMPRDYSTADDNRYSNEHYYSDNHNNN